VNWVPGGAAPPPPHDRVADIAGALFDTEDLRGAVRSFLEHGPGRATFEGR
jgi:hypothetical protein